MGRIRHIFIATAPGAAMVSHQTIEAIAELGLTGDRYANERSSIAPERQVTLIQNEYIQAFNESTGLPLSPDAPRRNLVTEGISLNDLCGQQFQVGAVVLEGIELCEPCATLARRTYPEIVKFFVHKGGLRAKIIQGGRIHIGDSVVAKP